MAKKTAKKTVSVETKPKNKKAGQPTKFTSAVKIAIGSMAESGLSNSEMIEKLEIDHQTYYNWKNVHVSFFDSIKDWRIAADCRVEDALMNTAMGKRVKVKKPVVVSDGADSGSHVEYHEFEEYIKPNVTAQKFWLTNRRASEWRDKREFDINEVKKLSDEEVRAKALAIMEKDKGY